MGVKERLVKSFKKYTPESFKRKKGEAESENKPYKDFTSLVKKNREVGGNSDESKVVGSRTSVEKTQLEETEASADKRRLEEIEFRSNIEKAEEEAWQKVLGAKVEVEPFTTSATPEVRKNLELMGFGLRYMPKLNFEVYKRIDRFDEVHWYLEELKSRFPKWSPLESLTEGKKEDHTVPRNLQESYWEDVKNGKNRPPILTGQWMAVETVDKPKHGEKYKRTLFAEKLGFPDDRLNVSWDDVHNAIVREESRILKDIGLPKNSARIRLLEPIEWNLLGNRKGWGKTDIYEWTNEPCLKVGYSFSGGVGSVYKEQSRSDRDEITGFRVAIVLD